ncbi:MAG TPA: hypothetical protein VGB18_09450, partial [Candidatus Thermoplasmatota archaeon]
MIRATIVSSLVLFAALSGCLADEAEPQSGTATEPAATTTGTNATTSTNATSATNTPPTANLTADVPNGTAPLNVTFTVNGTDDGDALNWTLDIDADGTAEYN